MKGKKLTEVTPVAFNMCFKHYPEPCCPAVFKDDEGNLFIIGKKVNKNKFPEIKKRVGKEEILISIPAGLVIDLKK